MKWIRYLFVAAISSIILFVCYWSYVNIVPLTSVDYALICKNEIEYDALIMKLSRLEGMVVVMQRIIPVYGGLIIAVILFLTWKQQNIAKSTAIQEINDSFKVYKDRIEELEEQAKYLVEEIKAKYQTLNQLGNLKLTDIIDHYFKDEPDGKKD